MRRAKPDMMTCKRASLAAACAAAGMLIACSGESKPQAPPSTQPAVAVAEPQPGAPLYFDESTEWTQTEAVAALEDESKRLAAIVRLIRLSECEPLWAPNPLPLKASEQLRTSRLSESIWAAGLATGDERRLAAPVVIDANGAVQRPLGDADDLLASLWISEDVDLIPHLLLHRGELFVYEDGEWTRALKTLRPSGLRFELRYERGYPHAALVLVTQPNEDGQRRTLDAGRYNWDAYEAAFSGPQCDNLPDPPGGQYELDLEASPALIPMGGVIPEPPDYGPPPTALDPNFAPPF